jgi:hypothetical protein
MFWDFQVQLMIVLAGLAIALKGYALIDALRVPKQAFPAAGKLTKPIWSGILGVALVLDVALFPSLSIFLLLGVVAAGVYLADVRPAVRAIGGGRRGTNTHDGPYGPW